MPRLWTRRWAPRFRVEPGRDAAAGAACGAALIEFSIVSLLVMSFCFGLYAINSLLTRKHQLESAVKAAAHYLSIRTGSFALDPLSLEAHPSCRRIAEDELARQLLITAARPQTGKVQLSGRYLAGDGLPVFQLSAFQEISCGICRFAFGRDFRLHATAAVVLESSLLSCEGW